MLSGYYLPGYRAGGPIRSVSGMVDSPGTNSISASSPPTGTWAIRSPTRASLPTRGCPWGKPGSCTCLPRTLLRALGRLISEIPHDALYLGGAFDPRFVLRPLLLRWLGLLPRQDIVVAPKGSFLRANAHQAPEEAYVSPAGPMAEVVRGRHVARIEPLRAARRPPVLRLLRNSHFVVVAPDLSGINASFRPAANLPQLQVVFLPGSPPEESRRRAADPARGRRAPGLAYLWTGRRSGVLGTVQEQDAELPPHVSVTYHGPISHREVAGSCSRMTCSSCRPSARTLAT